jgi:hypothetical protein
VKISNLVIVILIIILCALPETNVGAQQPTGGGAQATKPQTPQADEWVADFKGSALDEKKWERFSFEGGGGGKVEVKDGELRLRSANRTRAGVQSKQSFTGDRFIVEAKLAKVGPSLPDPGSRAAPLGFATLTIMFDGSGRNRIEWLLTSEGGFEAWSVVDGRGERLDNRKLGTKEKSPTLGIVRRGDDFSFMLNGEEGMRKTIKNMPRTFHLMLYGFGSSENNWEAARVVTVKQ